MKTDRIENIEGTLLHHGPHNDRVYMMKCSFTESSHDIAILKKLAQENNYGKIFAKIPASWSADFAAAGYVEEGRIPAYYGNEACVFACAYPKSGRAELSAEDKALVEEVLAAARAKGLGAQPASQSLSKLPAGYSLRMLHHEDADEMAALYREVFPSYPFPIHEPKYLQDTMDENIVYFGCFAEGRLCAASSAEMDGATQSVEMTDFATYPAHCGKGLALQLLQNMEVQMKSRGIRTLYTIARAFSYGMNITFAKAGYHFGGTLINNTDISGRIETMNIWYKQA